MRDEDFIFHMCIFLVTGPFTICHNFLPSDFDLIVTHFSKTLQLYKSKCGRPMSVSCLPELITWFEMLLSDVVGIRRLSLASVFE